MAGLPETADCPWCNEPLDAGADACPHCHRSPTQHPSRLDLAGPALPDLELELPLSAAPKARPAPPVAPPAGRASSPGGRRSSGGERASGAGAAKARAAGGRAAAPPALEQVGDTFDDELGGPLAVDLALDSSGPPSAKTARKTAERGSRSLMRKWKGDRQEAGPEEIDLDHAAVEDFAGWGESPAQLWNAPAYSWRVWQRRRQIQRQIEDSEPAFDRLVARRRARLAEIGRKLRELGRRSKDAEFGRLLVEIEGQSKELDAATGQRPSRAGGPRQAEERQQARIARVVIEEFPERIDPATSKEIARLDAEIDTQRRALALCQRALASFDGRAYQRGIIVAVAAVLAVLALLGWLTRVEPPRPGRSAPDGVGQSPSFLRCPRT
ncbi:MAG: hypothetical protein HY744_09865 [Deltaproteobacteria bacterium]|nr:hypothetical protein [Deltaproteobacteria bacterium]